MNKQQKDLIKHFVFFFHQGNKIPTCLISTYTHLKNYSPHNTLYFRPVQLIPQVLKTKNNPDTLKQILSNQFFFFKSHIDHSIVIETTLISCSNTNNQHKDMVFILFLKRLSNNLQWLLAHSVKSSRPTLKVVHGQGSVCELFIASSHNNQRN